VKTAVEQLVWAHNHGPAEARTVATEYFVRNGRRIRVDVNVSVFGSVCLQVYCLSGVHSPGVSHDFSTKLLGFKKCCCKICFTGQAV
jgi:hypothetical protein